MIIIYIAQYYLIACLASKKACGNKQALLAPWLSNLFLSEFCKQTKLLRI